MNRTHKFQAFLQNLYHGIEARRAKNASEYEGPTFDALSLGIMCFSIFLLMMDNTKSYSEEYAWTFFILSLIFMVSILVPKIGSMLSSILNKSSTFTRNVFPTLLFLFSIAIVNGWFDSMDNIDKSVIEDIGFVVTAWFIIFLLIIISRVHLIVGVAWITIYFVVGIINLCSGDCEGAIAMFIVAVLSTTLVTGLIRLYDDLRL